MTVPADRESSRSLRSASAGHNDEEPGNDIQLQPQPKSQTQSQTEALIPTLETSTSPTSHLLHPKLRESSPRLWRQFLHPIAWILLLCVGGPILLHELAIHFLDGVRDVDGVQETLPCDVQEVWTSWATLFQVNIRTRKLSFTAVKIIDVAFDLVVGRGGQFVLGWVSYRVYNDVWTRLTEQTRLNYKTMAAVTLHPNQLSTLVSAVKAWVSRTTNLRTALTLLWIILAMTYVLAYPTIVSAASSLVGATSTAISLPNNGTAPIDAYIATASYQFSNTELAGKPNPWIVSVDNITKIGDLVHDACFLIMNLGVRSSGWSGATNYNDIVVNGTTFSLSNNTQVACGFYYDGEFVRANTSTQNAGMQALYDSRITCIPDGHRYQWGVSWELLVILLILQIVWSISLLVMWIDATTHSQLVQKGRKMGTWRALLDLAEPLSTALGPAAGLYGEDELDQIVRRQPPVRYEMMIDDDHNGGQLQHVSLVSSFEAFCDGGGKRRR